MENSGFSGRFCRKCLHSSLSIEDMIRFAQMVYPDYDIHQKSEYPIAAKDVASHIVTTMIKAGYYVDFVELLIKVDATGYMGRRCSLRGLDDVIGDLIQAGFNYDRITGRFFENQQERISRNWGRLFNGNEQQMAVLRLDIAGNSILVKENPKNLIEKAYGDMRNIVTKAVVSRLGRLWSWEGDGALSAFMLGDYSRMAIFAGIEVLNNMLLYNKMHNPLNSGIRIRLAVHSGLVVYSSNEADCLKTDLVKKAITLESKAATPDSLVISESLALTQDQAVLNIFSNAKTASSEKYRIYQVMQERS
jgi:class 3 adenylate cyclase